MSTEVAQHQVVATDAAAAVLRHLTATFGPLILIQSGGCCDGSSPICLQEGVPFYCDREQYERWNRPSLVLDVGHGPAEGFSLEGLAGVHFRTCETPRE